MNITVKQELFLQTFREIALKLNLKYNTINTINNFNQLSKATQQASLSELATKICNNRYVTKKHKQRNDKFWVYNYGIWKFYGNLITKGRLIYRAIGALLRDACKYAYGKRIISRTNWKEKSFQIVGDSKGKKRQQLCIEANNLKRAYEMKITENILTSQFQQITQLY